VQLLAIVFVFAAGITWFVTSDRSENALERIEGSVVEPSGAARADAKVSRAAEADTKHPTGSDAPGSVRNGSLARSLDRDPVAVALNARSATEALDALIPAMEAGSARAMLAHRELIGRCADFRDGVRFWPRPTAPEESAVWSAQRDAIEHEGNYCGKDPMDPRLQDPLLRGARAITEKLNAMAASGDPDALAFALGTGALDRLLKSEELAALDLLRGDASIDARARVVDKLITGRIKSEYSHFGSDVFDRAGTAFDRRRTLKQLAVEVHRCQIGGSSCGAGGRLQNQHCIAFGDCASHLTWDQFIMTRLVTPHEARVVASLVEKLSAFPP
jgi:hypothetical protein